MDNHAVQQYHAASAKMARMSPRLTSAHALVVSNQRSTCILTRTTGGEAPGRIPNIMA